MQNQEFTPKIYKYHKVDQNKNIDEWIDVTEELWKWVAILEDGSELHQFDDNTGLFHRLSEIDQKRLHVFKMVSRAFPDRTFTIIFNPKFWKLIHVYKRTRLNHGDPENDTGWFTLYVFGYENNVNGINVTNLNVILPNGELVTTDDFNKLAIY